MKKSADYDGVQCVQKMVGLFKTLDSAIDSGNRDATIDVMKQIESVAMDSKDHVHNKSLKNIFAQRLSALKSVMERVENGADLSEIDKVISGSL